MDAPPVPTTRTARNVELDHLRAYAVIMVVALHLMLLLAPGTRVAAVLLGTTNLGSGVDLFFAISGFVIAGTLGALWTLAPSQPVPPGVIGDFFVRRFWRLWPASTLWISYCLLAASIWSGRDGWPPVGQVAWQWVTAVVPVFELREFIRPTWLGYYWTLSVEWQFYAVFPFLLVWLRSGRTRAAALAALFALSIYVNLISFMLRFSGIIGGVAVHALRRDGRAAAPGPTTAHRWVFQGLTPLLLVVLVTVPQLGRTPLIGQPVRTLLCALLVGMAAAERGLTGDCGMPRLLTWIGLRSYSLYLCHIPVALTLLCVVDRLRGGRVVPDTGLSLSLIGAAAAIALVLADLTYRHVELPLQRRYRPVPSARPAT